MLLSAHSRRALVAASAALAAAPVAEAKKKKRKKKRKSLPPLVFAVVEQIDFQGLTPNVDNSIEVRVDADYYYPAGPITGAFGNEPLTLSISAAQADLVAGVQKTIADEFAANGTTIPADRIAVTLL